MGAPDPTDDELVVFAESLLRNVGKHLRERHVLQDAVRQHRATWVKLYAASAALKGVVGADAVPGDATS